MKQERIDELTRESEARITNLEALLVVMESHGAQSDKDKTAWMERARKAEADLATANARIADMEKERDTLTAKIQALLLWQNNPVIEDDLATANATIERVRDALLVEPRGEMRHDSDIVKAWSKALGIVLAAITPTTGEGEK